MNGWQVLGVIILPVILSFIGIYLTNRMTIKVGKENSKSIVEATNKLVVEARRGGVNCIEKDLKELNKGVIEIIQANGHQTRESIEAVTRAIESDGHQTRESIEAILKKSR